MWRVLTVVLFCVMTERSSGGGVQSNFACYPNQTIRFTNPDTGLYTHFRALYDNFGTETDCIVSTVDGNGYAYMDCASTTATITLYISSRNLTSDNIVSKYSAVYTFRCSTIEIRNETLSNSLTVNINETSESNAPSFNITSAFYGPTGDIVTEATVGETVYYIITGPSQYNLKPLQCNATGSTTNDHTILIVDGCNLDDDLISDFDINTVGQESKYNASVHVFKFYKSDILTITCNVLVCAASDDCSFECVPFIRKRYVTISSEFKRDVGDDLKTSTVGNSLRILDAQLGGAPTLYESVRYMNLQVLLLTMMLI